MAVSAPSQISLQELLVIHGQAVSEQQAWALCYQACWALQQPQSLARNWKQPPFSKVDDLTLYEDGTVVCVSTNNGNLERSCTEEQVVESLGILIYRALDWSLGEDEERVISLPLEELIQQMVLRTEDQPPGTINEIITVNLPLLWFQMCEIHFQSSSIAAADHRAVCKALFTETLQLCSYRNTVKSAKKTLNKLLEDEPTDERCSDAGHWRQTWVQLMKDVRSGVRLRKICERNYKPLPMKPQLSQFNKVLGDIKYRQYILRKVTINEPRTPCDVSVDFGLLRSLLKPAATRKLKDLPTSSPCLHEMLMREIQLGVKLQPVSSEPDMSMEWISPKLSSWMDTPMSMWHSIDRQKFQFPLRISKSLCMGYKYVEIENFLYSSSLFIKELVCGCQTKAEREVANGRMAKEKFCLFCQRELFFTWADTCHCCKKINLFRVLYEARQRLVSRQKGACERKMVQQFHSSY
ncbi:protein spire homolog 1-like isoform X2 [Scyliorhinus canicula]|uniref:protein spire homolog 1-like isoform X2 n=1 Tax=Scyliorhinus canicula TaxID=7830 RepID=UPI0018F55A8D|nr:protein spire homolog 1-like isoform X2 [Scyliorhinus canicula]